MAELDKPGVDEPAWLVGAFAALPVYITGLRNLGRKVSLKLRFRCTWRVDRELRMEFHQGRSIIAGMLHSQARLGPRVLSANSIHETLLQHGLTDLEFLVRLSV